jgi:hypothetical protein
MRIVRGSLLGRIFHRPILCASLFMLQRLLRWRNSLHGPILPALFRRAQIKAHYKCSFFGLLCALFIQFFALLYKI